jgi:hypothetical protein
LSRHFIMNKILRRTSGALLCALFISFILQNAFGQSLTGKVQETGGSPLPGVNVLLLRSGDSTLVKSAVSDPSGTYALEGVGPGTYILAASIVGYKTAYLPAIAVSENKEAMQLAAFTMEIQPTQLIEVAIKAKRPFVEQQTDRTVINVANSIVSSGGTALEVLEKAPGVAVDRQTDQVQLRGKEGVIVQIDGKQTYLSMADVVAMLGSMPSDNIDQIELITNPSARYDAAGNSGIINIKLKKKSEGRQASAGTNGMLTLTGGTGKYGRQRGSIQLNHRMQEANFFGSYGINNDKNYWDFTNERVQPNKPGAEQTRVSQESFVRQRDFSQNAKVGIDYFLGKSTTLGVVWTGFWTNSYEKSPAKASFREQEDGPEYLRTLTQKSLTNLFSNQIGNVNFQHTFAKRKGGANQLTADFDLGHFTRDFKNSLTTQTLFPQTPATPLTGLFTHMPVEIDIVAGKVDYTLFLSSDWKMETGLKSSSVRSDNAMSLSEGPAGNLVPNDSLSNHFRYKEQINAAYASFSGKLGKKTDVLIGLRAEHTHSVGRSLTLGTLVKRDYLNLFPSLFISRAMSASQALTFSYSYRIDRPSYQTLNPARSFVDPYFFSVGNPYLKPQLTHSLELKHAYQNKIFTSFGASFTDDLIFFSNRPVNETVLDRFPENFGESQAYNLTLSFPVQVSEGWTMQMSLLGVYSRFQYEYLGRRDRVEQFSGRLNGSGAFILGKGWTAEINGWINTPETVALRHFDWKGTLDAGVQKTFSPRLKARLSIQDIFHTNRSLAVLDNPELKSTTTIRTDSRVALLNLSWSFGNQKLKAARQRKTGSDEEIKRAN